MLVTERSDGSSRRRDSHAPAASTAFPFCLYYSFFIRFSGPTLHVTFIIRVIKLDLFLFRSPLSLKAILKGWKCVTLRRVAVIPTKM